MSPSIFSNYSNNRSSYVKVSFHLSWGRHGGETPVEGGSGKAVGFEARGETFSFLLYLISNMSYGVIRNLIILSLSMSIS
jgi:hypothetical protein